MSGQGIAQIIFSSI